jgi:hypothetical protein
LPKPGLVSDRPQVAGERRLDLAEWLAARPMAVPEPRPLSQIRDIAEIPMARCPSSFELAVNTSG